MIAEPYSIFKPFADRFEVRFFRKEDTMRTDEDLANILGSHNLATVEQTHQNGVATVSSSILRAPASDGILTAQPDLWLGIRAADCQLFVVYAPEHHVAGLLHAGWKGLKLNAISAFFSTLTETWGIDPAETYVAAGPSLCTACSEFTDPATELHGLDPRHFHGRNADLRAIADDQLFELGVLPEHFERSPDCTKCRSDLYWTYRGESREEVIQGYRNMIACRLK